MPQMPILRSDAAADSVSMHAMPGIKPRPVLAYPEPRRMNREQGEALEKLAHAIEYLIDTYMVKRGGLLDLSHTPEYEAIQMLMRLNRQIFAGGQPYVPLIRRIVRALPLGLHRTQMVRSGEHEPDHQWP